MQLIYFLKIEVFFLVFLVRVFRLCIIYLGDECSHVDKNLTLLFHLIVLFFY